MYRRRKEWCPGSAAKAARGLMGEGTVGRRWLRVYDLADDTLSLCGEGTGEED